MWPQALKTVAVAPAFLLDREGGKELSVEKASTFYLGRDAVLHAIGQDGIIQPPITARKAE